QGIAHHAAIQSCRLQILIYEVVDLCENLSGWLMPVNGGTYDNFPIVEDSGVRPKPECSDNLIIEISRLVSCQHLAQNLAVGSRELVDYTLPLLSNILYQMRFFVIQRLCIQTLRHSIVEKQGILIGQCQ